MVTPLPPDITQNDNQGDLNGMKTRYLLPALLLSLATSGIHAEAPPEFAIMSDQLPDGVPLAAMPFEQPFFRNVKPDADAVRRGFMAGVIEPDFQVINTLFISKPTLDKELTNFAARGQYIIMTFAVEMLSDQPELKIEITPPANTQGDELSTDNLKLRRIISRRLIRNYSGDMLVRPEAANLKKGEVVHYALFISVPAETAPGEYQGKLSIRGAAGEDTLPIRLRVLEFELPPAEAVFGLYMGGHFDTTGTGHKRWSPDFFKPEHLESMFTFWKTRGLNSPTITHVLPRFQRIDGKAIPDFITVRQFADAMKKVGLEGPLCIDSRFHAWYAEAVEKGTGAKAEDVYQDQMKALIETAEQENWVDIKIFPEEEVGNPDNTKKRTYNRFWKPLREVAGGRDYIVDNDIGYGRSNAIDRGNDDNFPIVQYNSWEDSALQKARENNRQIWAYNYGFKRSSFGFLLERLGATGNHQWADMWYTDEKHHWVFTAFLEDGVVTGMNYEWTHAGIDDYRYMKLLKAKIAELESKNMAAEAAAAKQVLVTVSKDIPITSLGYASWSANYQDREFNRRRWMVAQEILKADQALNGKTAEPAPAPAATLTATTTPVQGKEEVKSTNIIQIPLFENPKLDGIPDLRAANTTGALRRRVVDETNARAYSSSDEEYQRRIATSWTQVWLTYDRQGLLISCIGNEASPGSKNQAKFLDGDGNLWQDACMEYFFQLPDQKGYYQLIVNTKDQKVLINTNNNKMTHQAVRVFSTPNFNPARGLAQEVLIPWSEFGLPHMPDSGTVWKFNACREFHAWNQYLTWGRVHSEFSEVAEWGSIAFTGKSANTLFEKVSSGSIFPGENRISGQLKPLAQKSLIQLKNASRKVLAEKAAEAGTSPEFDFNFNVPPITKSEIWTLEIANQATREKLDAFSLPVNAAVPSVNIVSADAGGICGQDLSFRIYARASNLSISKYPLRVRAVSGDKTIDYPPVVLQQNGNNQLWLSTGALTPGRWQISCYLDGLGRPDDKSGIAVEILPPY